MGSRFGIDLKTPELISDYEDENIFEKLDQDIHVDEEEMKEEVSSLI